MSDNAFSVTQFVDIVNLSFEQFESVAVEGEISSSTKASSGHWYFSIKDEEAVLSCAMFRGKLYSVRGVFKVGDKVRVTGKPNLYPGSGKLTFICSKIEAAGEGKLYELFLRLKNELAALGWFDQNRKKPIPRVPRTIGIITSRTGAALQDVMNRLRERAPYVRVLLYHTAVQGKGAEAEIVQRINKANSDNKADVLLLVRGGGSLEDLWCFNEKIVAEAIVNSHIPIISGIGHETDTTIADFAADFRAPTPTGAAEAAAEKQSVLFYEIDSAWNLLHRSFENQFNRALQDVENESRPFENPQTFLETFRHRLSAVSYLQRPVLDYYRQNLTFLRTRLQLDMRKSLSSSLEREKFAARYFISPSRFIEPYEKRLQAASPVFRLDTTSLQNRVDLIFVAISNSQDSRLRLSRGEVGVFSDNFRTAMNGILRSAGDSLRLVSPQMTYAFGAQESRCNEIFSLISGVVQSTIAANRKELLKESSWLRRSRPKLDRAPLNAACTSVRNSLIQKFEKDTIRLRSLEQVWELLDPAKQIRGNSAFIYRGGKPVMSVSELKEGSDIEVMMKDGAFVARVGEIKKD